MSNTLHSYEEPEVITLDDLNSVRTRELSPSEIAELEDAIWQTNIKGAVEGKVLWYEIHWRNKTNGGIGLLTKFRRVDSPITPDELAAITAAESYSTGTEFELYCYTGNHAQALIDEINMYDSLFDSTGRVASFEIPIDPSLAEIPIHKLESLVSFWVKE